jgi:hypothetical protein
VLAAEQWPELTETDPGRLAELYEDVTPWVDDEQAAVFASAGVGR